MHDYSIKELRMLATRAARGSYMPWGMAEEAGASVAWLEQRGIGCIDAFTALLRHFDGQDPGEIGSDFQTATNPGNPTCPILVGCYLSDLAGQDLCKEKLQLRAIQSPILLVPFLTWVVGDLGENLLVDFGDTKFRLDSEGIEILNPGKGMANPDPQKVSISITAAALTNHQENHPRVVISDKDREELIGFLERTYLPESEASRASGAGGGSVDDD